MFAKRFSAGLCLSVAFGIGPAEAEPPAAADRVVLELAQARVKESSLDDLPAVDKDRGPGPSRATRPPPVPPVPPAPRVTTRTPPDDEETSPPPREVPPPGATSRRNLPPPPRLNETPDTRRADTTRRVEPPPRLEEPPPRRAGPPPREARRPPSGAADRSGFYAKCTEQCHLSCEAAFEACNGDSSPAKPACVKKLEACRVERCSCRFE